MKKKIILFLICLFSLLPVFGQSDKDYKYFVSIVKSELKELKIGKYEDHFNDQYFTVKEKNDYFDIGSEIGLTNLYNICSQSDKSNWKNIVKGHFEQLKQTRQEEKEFLPKLETFNTGKDCIKIRLYPNEYKEKFSQTSIIDSSNEDYIGIVVIDFPSGVKNLTKEYISKWSTDEKEILQAAIKNTIKDNTELFEEYKISDSFSISVMLSDENIYVTSSVYNLAQKHSISKYGAFVGLPNRYGILLKDIDRETVNTDIVQMANLINYMYQQGPGSITNTVFWFDGTKFYKVIHDPSKGMIKLPDELVKLLK